MILKEDYTPACRQAGIKTKPLQMFMKKKFLILRIFLTAAFFIGCTSLSGKDFETKKDNVREIKVEAFKYGFKPDPIVVKKGENIRLLVTSNDVRHGFYCPEYNINKPVEPKKVTTIEFKADKAGKFRIRCSIFCGPGHSSMHGELDVLK